MYKIIKEAGYTMNQTIDKFKTDNNINEKVCYCGRLDPMARGLVILLAGHECKNMDKYLYYNKEYEFEIIFGLSTDTDDPMGIISFISFFKYNEIKYYCEKIKEYIVPKKFQQNFHNYSSKRIKGMPMWKYANTNTYIEKPTHEVEIFNVEYSPIKIYNFNEWKNNIIENINKIDKKNNFRQEEIINNYNLLDLDVLYALPIKIKVSSGFYVRQLIADIKNYFDIAILTFDINRISIQNK